MSSTKSLEVRWDGELVGYIDEPRVDMFHVYGEWRPTQGAVSALFESKRVAGEDLHVAIAGGDEEMTGIVGDDEPGYIDVVCGPN